MANEKRAEIHIILNREEGFSRVQVVGPTENHLEGHDLYFEVIDLIEDFQQAVNNRLGEDGAHEEH